MRSEYIWNILALGICAGATQRCTSSQPCWPSSATWATFNSSINGRLVAPRPSAWPCHDPHFDSTACAEVQGNWSNSFWRADQTGAMQDPLWESTGCWIDTPRNVTCKQGLVPTYAVAAEGQEDVVKAVRFASKHKLKVVVKNTGHDYLGRSSGAGSLSIWTHKLGGIKFVESFVADGCGKDKAIPAVTLGAAAHWYDVYREADKRNVLVVGGAARSVGAAGGWVQGGGHSPLGGKYGMGVDNVLQFQVVKANGKVVTANKCKNKDLFWALRGGGGGTWGVPLKVTYKTHPPLKSISVLGVSINITDSKAMREFSELFISMIPAISDAGARGFAVWTPPNSFFTLLAHPDSSDIQSINKTFAPVWDWVKSHPETSAGSIGSVHSTYFGFIERYINDVLIGLPVWMGSRLVSRNALHNKSKQLAKYALGGGEYVSLTAVIVDPDSTSLNPAWRKDALTHWTYGAGWLSSTPAKTVEHIKSTVTKLTQGVGEIAGLDHASYFNEADPREPQWKRAFFGPHYPRLQKIKRQVDPDNLFTCNRCVGSD
ncbi:FAD-binding domain-containing protein [Ceratobasidium sp. AG-I]|nr:FAD-binding domain-containing protein [Ceratobasidium sp. AG-I]